MNNINTADSFESQVVEESGEGEAEEEDGGGEEEEEVTFEAMSEDEFGTMSDEEGGDTENAFDEELFAQLTEKKKNYLTAYYKAIDKNKSNIAKACMDGLKELDAFIQTHAETLGQQFVDGYNKVDQDAMEDVELQREKRERE